MMSVLRFPSFFSSFVFPDLWHVFTNKSTLLVSFTSKLSSSASLGWEFWEVSAVALPGITSTTWAFYYFLWKGGLILYAFESYANFIMQWIVINKFNTLYKYKELLSVLPANHPYISHRWQQMCLSSTLWDRCIFWHSIKWSLTPRSGCT